MRGTARLYMQATRALRSNDHPDPKNGMYVNPGPQLGTLHNTPLIHGTKSKANTLQLPRWLGRPRIHETEGPNVICAIPEQTAPVGGHDACCGV